MEVLTEEPDFQQEMILRCRILRQDTWTPKEEGNTFEE